MQDITNYNRGTIALQKGNLEKALQFYKREKNQFKELYLNMANTYRMLGNNLKAWEYYTLANDVTITDLDGNGGEYTDALSNMGLLAYQEGSDSLASSYYVRALSIDPLHYKSIWNNSLALLRGYCSGGALHKHAWKMHEYRFKAVKPISPVSSIWDGSPVSKLVILAEQGVGDRLMYSRYLSMISCDEIWVQCDASMDCFFSDYKICRTVEESGCTIGIPIGSLAAMFGDVKGKWLTGSGKAFDSGFNIIVEWAGSGTHLNDRNRSCYAGYFSTLAKRLSGRGIRLHNVRPDSLAVKGVNKLPSSSWSESRDWVACADLVVSVDTSLVHLAGSLGVNTLMMQPLCDSDFRWGNVETKRLNNMLDEDNIWYADVKVLENYGWDRIFDDVYRRIIEEQNKCNQLQWLGGLTVEQFVEKHANNK